MGNTLAFDKDFSKPLIMGILNVTPDSFSDGGQYLDPQKAVNRCFQMIEEGADILDIGGESSGPNSQDVSLEEELRRVIPVIMRMKNEELRMRNGRRVLISVDTWKAEVARQALESGADMVNDVTALRGDKEMARVLSNFHCPVVLMYSKDTTARTTRKMVQYNDVIQTVRDFLVERIEYGMMSGIARERLILDPGMGAFVSGDAKYSLQILKRLAELKSFGLPILVGASRKGFISQVFGEIKNEELRMKNGGVASQPFLDGAEDKLPVNERLEGSLGCAVVAMMNGASILRVHDVKETRRLVSMIYEIMKS